MKRVSSCIILIVLLFSFTGCTTLQKGFDGVKQGASKLVEKFKSRKERRKDPQKKTKNELTGRGYLAQGTFSPVKLQEDAPEPISKDKEVMVEKSKITKGASKAELLSMVKGLEEQLGDERKSKERALDELSAFKVEFQKQIFETSNQLAQEKVKNRELNDKMVKAELESLKAKQQLSEIKTSILMQRNMLQSTYPILYKVEKGDSLWKIAGRAQIYNNSYNWLEIFYANREKLEDKDLIYPGMLLKIPRYHELLLSNFEISSNLGNGEIRKNNDEMG